MTDRIGILRKTGDSDVQFLIARIGELETALREAVNEAHGAGLIRDHPEGTGAFTPTHGGQWPLCPNTLCRDARALLEQP